MLGLIPAANVTRLVLNWPDLAAGLYSVEIPADVEVTRGFSGLPDFDSGDASQ